MEYPKDSQGYQWSKQGDVWYYWNGETWLPGTPPPEIAPPEKKPFPIMPVIVVALLLAVVGGASYYFITLPPTPELSGVCACLGPECEEKALVLEVPEEAVEYARQLGATVEGNEIVIDGREYYDGTTTIAVTDDAAAVGVYEQVLQSGEWDEITRGPTSVYRKGDTTVVVRGGIVVVGPNAEEVIECSYLP